MLLSCTVVLPTAHVAYNLQKLAIACDVRFIPVNKCRQITVQADPANSGNVYAGDSITSDATGPGSNGQQCAAKLGPGASYNWGPTGGDIMSFEDATCVGDVANQKVNIGVMRGN
jgi:hypothetical protein